MIGSFNFIRFLSNKSLCGTIVGQFRSHKVQQQTFARSGNEVETKKKKRSSLERISILSIEERYYIFDFVKRIVGFDFGLGKHIGCRFAGKDKN